MASGLATRMPLSVGAGACLSLGKGAAAFGPAGWLTTVLIAALPASLDSEPEVLAIYAVLVLALAYVTITALRDAWREQPSDVLLSRDGLRVEGGPHDGLSVAWNEVAGVDLSGGRLSVQLRGRGRLALARARFDDEKRSHAALAATLTAAAGGAVQPFEATNVIPFGCEGCGAAIVPRDADVSRCDHCGHAQPVSPELRAQVRAASSLGDRADLDRRLNAVLRQPGARGRRLLFVVAALGMVAVWGLTYWLYRLQTTEADVVRMGTAMAIMGFPFLAIGGLTLLLRASLVDRFALATLTLGFAARIGTRGEALCHECAAALPPAGDHVAVRCVFCRTDNLLGLDWGGRAARRQRDRDSLRDTLAWRARARLVWGLGGLLLAAPLFYRAVMLYREGSERARFTTVVAATARKGREIWDTRQSIGRPAVTRDGAHMLVIYREADQPDPVVGYVDLRPGAPRPKPLWTAPGLRDPAWIDDREYLVVAEHADGMALQRASIDGGAGEVIHTASLLARPSVAPDGRRAVFAQGTDLGFELRVIDLDSRASEHVVDGHSPAWHPLRDVVAYVANADRGDGVEGTPAGESERLAAALPKVHWIDLAKPEPQRLLEPDEHSHADPAWSPCGGWLVFATNEDWQTHKTGTRDGTFNLMVATWDSKLAGVAEPQLLWLTDGSAQARRPAWAFGSIWWESDQYDRAVVWELAPLHQLNNELYANPRCPHAK